MKSNVNVYQFESWFEKHRPNTFSRTGLQSLFDYLEEYEDSTGEQIEFDPIALCCEYTEYEDLDEFKANDTCEKYQDIEDLDGLYDYTQVIPVGKDSFIIQDF